MVFAAVVWGIAATFVAFEIIAVRGRDIALSFPDLVGGIALSRAVTESTSCTVRAANGTGETRPSAAELRDARVGAWLLGIALGRDAVYRQRETVSAQLLEQSADAVLQLAGQLRVPAPSVFRPGQIITANIEFVPFVENDATETARRLAESFSPHVCELFKLAALWGYSDAIRPSVPGERAVFAMEIRHYAKRAQLPEALWSPMMQRLPSDANFEDARNEMTTLTNGVTTYLAQH
jgi:hypothetical protein